MCSCDVMLLLSLTIFAVAAGRQVFIHLAMDAFSAVVVAGAAVFMRYAPYSWRSLLVAATSVALGGDCA